MTTLYYARLYCVTRLGVFKLRGGRLLGQRKAEGAEPQGDGKPQAP